MRNLLEELVYILCCDGDKLIIGDILLVELNFAQHGPAHMVVVAVAAGDQPPENTLVVPGGGDPDRKSVV